MLIDPKAVLFLLGTVMDFKVEPLKSGFVFDNPNQTSACGCGESVQLKPASRETQWTPDASEASVTLAASTEFLEFVTEQMAGVGAVTARRMFGGAGIFCGPHMIGLVADDLLYLRSDGEAPVSSRQEGSSPSFTARAASRLPCRIIVLRKNASMIRRIMTLWAGKAYQAALRAPTRRPGKSKANRQRCEASARAFAERPAHGPGTRLCDASFAVRLDICGSAGGCAAALLLRAGAD